MREKALDKERLVVTIVEMFSRGNVGERHSLVHKTILSVGCLSRSVGIAKVKHTLLMCNWEMIAVAAWARCKTMSNHEFPESGHLFFAVSNK